MLKNNIIAVVGLCGSGKSIVCEYIENEKSYKKVYFGGIVIEEVKRRGLPVIESNEKAVREELRERYGMSAMAVLSKENIEKHLKAGYNVLIDGLYSMSEYKVLKQAYPKMITLAVFTPKKLRYERLSQREVRPLTLEEAERRDFAEIENIEKGGPIAIADYTIINDGSVDDLLSKTEVFINKIKPEV